MRLFRNVLALVVVLAVAAGASAADKAAKKAAKKSAKPVAGVVVDVQKDTVTVKVAAKKTDANAQAVEKKFTISGDTKVVKVSGKKGAQETKEAAAADLKKDQRVRVTAKGEIASEVQILEAKKKSK